MPLSGILIFSDLPEVDGLFDLKVEFDLFDLSDLSDLSDLPDSRLSNEMSPLVPLDVISVCLVALIFLIGTRESVIRRNLPDKIFFISSAFFTVCPFTSNIMSPVQIQNDRVLLKDQSN